MSQRIWNDVARFLRSGDAYLNGRAPEVIETHISLVFLQDQLVYKLKKPVSYDFLSFATVGERRRACEKELELNRRLAPEVYLGVVPITSDDAGKLAIGGSGRPVEWLVEMRRLPYDKMLNVMLTSEAKPSVDVDALVGVLSAFYRNASPIPIDASSYRRCEGEHIRGNLRELLKPEHELSELSIQRIHGRQLRFVSFETALLDGRVSQGRIIDGHGDLRPEHVCMEKVPVIFDCIEFNDDLRHIDAVDELCFLAMECECLGAPEMGRRLLSGYSRATGDAPPARLLDFYKSYRACVRAKVTALRSLQLREGDDGHFRRLARAFLQAADRHLGWTSQHVCVLVRGLVGSGKSTVASGLAETLGMSLLQTDRIRRAEVAAVEKARYGLGLYAPENRIAVYESMFEAAEHLLGAGVSVILDACFLRRDLQLRVRELTQALGVPLLIVTCRCPDEVAARRIVLRAAEPGCLSDARPEHIAEQKAEDQGSLSGVPSLAIDTSDGTTLSHVRAVCEQVGLILGAFGRDCSDKTNSSGIHAKD